MVPTAQVRDRTVGDLVGGSAAEVELGTQILGRRAGGCNRCNRHEVGGESEVVENVCSDPRLGDEREHAQMITAARTLGDLLAEHPA